MSITERFAALFTGRTDAAGVFDPARNDTSVKRESVTLDTYQTHLDGGRSLGVFPLRDDGTVKWFAFDIDTGDFALAIRIRNALADLGFFPWIERSKGKGYHVFVFLQKDVRAAIVRRLANSVLATVGSRSLEVFPKQDRVTPPAGLGNFLNLPYFGGQTDRRVFVEDDGTPIGLRDFLDRVQTSPFDVDEEPAPRTNPKGGIVVGFGDRQGYDGPAPACVLAAMSTPLAEGDGRNEVLARLVGYWSGLVGEDTDAVAELLSEWNESNVDPLSEREFQETVRKVSRGSYSWGCDRLRESEIFHDACVWDACGLYKPNDAPQVIAFEDFAPSPSRITVEQAPPITPAKLTNEQDICRAIESGWIKDYVDMSKRLTDSPRLYHVVTALAVQAVILGNRVRIPAFGARDMHPNLYFVVMGPSGFYRKSTACEIGMAVLEKVDSGAIFADSFSPEALISGLAARADQIVHIDEFGDAMAMWSKKQYLQGIKGLLTTLFDNRPYKRVLKGANGKGVTEEITNTALSILATTTVDFLQTEMQLEDLRSGFTSRILWLWAEEKEPRVRRRPTDRDESMEAVCVHLRKWQERENIRADFSRVDDYFFDWLDAFEDEYTGNLPPEISGIVARAGTHAQKLAVVLAASDSLPNANDYLVIQPEHIERAVEFVSWSVERQKYMVTDVFQFSDLDKMRSRLIDALRARGGRMTLSEATRVLGQKSRDFKELIDTLRMAQYIRKVQPTKRVQGRTPTIICLPNAVAPDEEDVA